MRVIRTHLLVLVLLAVVTVTLTFPVALETARGSSLPGLKEFDEFEYAWLMWWFDAALVHRHIDPAALPFYYPMQTNQPLVTVTPLGWLLSIPLVSLLGPIVAYNVYWLLNFVLCAYAAYLLAFWLTRSRPAAFVGGLIFAFYPGKMLHGLGHFGDMMIFMFPLFILFLLRFVRQPDFRRAVLLAVITCLGLLIDFRHIGLFYLPFTVLFLAYQMAVNRRRLLSPGFLKWGTLAVAAVFVIVLPFVGPFTVAGLGGQLGQFKEGGVEASSADLLSFVLPPMTHPLLGQIPVLKQWMQAVWTESLYIETALYFGFTATALAVVALVRRRRGAWLWTLVGLVGAILALGPRLKIGGRWVTQIPLPYAFLNRLPFYEWVRIPGRMDMMIKLALAMCAALGLAVWLGRKSVGKRTLIAGTLSILILFEYATFVPYPTADVQPSPFLQRLAGDGQDYGILHIASHEYAMYLQTLHGHRMVEGHIHRWPPGGFEWALQLHDLLLYPVQTEQAYYDILDEKLPYGRDGGWIFSASADLAPGKLLSEQGIRYVVFDRKGPWTRSDRELYVSRLKAYLGDPVEEDKRLSLYEVKPSNSGARLIPTTGWYPLEGEGRDLWRWSQGAAEVAVEEAKAGLYRFKLAVRPLQSGQRLSVQVNGASLGEYALGGPTEIITPPFTLDGSAAFLHLSTPEGCRSPFNVWRGNLDGRCLGLALSEVRLFPALAQPLRFGEQLELMGYEITRGPGPDTSTYVSLYWQAVDWPARDFTAFVHAVDEQGATLAQADLRLQDRRGHPTSAWRAGDAVRSFHQLPPGGTAIKVGLYDLATMERLPLRDDRSGENAVTVGTSER